jgi:hypothetical protein
MVLLQILKRKDAASVVVAVVAALILSSFISDISAWPASWLGGNEHQGSFRKDVWAPIIATVIEFFIFELAVRIYLNLVIEQKKTK